MQSGRHLSATYECVTTHAVAVVVVACVLHMQQPHQQQQQQQHTPAAAAAATLSEGLLAPDAGKHDFDIDWTTGKSATRIAKDAAATSRRPSINNTSTHRFVIRRHTVITRC